MINRFLKVKHWQLFLLIFGFPTIFQLVFMSSIFSAISTNPGPEMIFSTMKFFPILMILFMAILLGWFWSIAIGLQKKVPEHITMKVKKFKTFFLIYLAYILCLTILIAFAMNGMMSGVNEPSVVNIGTMFAIIVPLHLFSMFCILYSLYFVAKTFKTVELQREVKFSDFAGEFFLILFYPVGIWIIQPKINKMMME
jgi:hypothetical protein